jgi:hypothetical protein
MRKVVVLAEAAEDIEQARNFYDAQEPGIGKYCADSLVADIESPALTTESIPIISDFTECSPSDFLSAFITAKPKRKRTSSPFWICGAIPIGSAKNFRGAVKTSFAATIHASTLGDQCPHIHRFHSG